MSTIKNGVSVTEYLNAMEKAINELDNMPLPQARTISIKSLQKSGVLTKSGTLKKTICTTYE